jgi:hypothetical protein
MVIGKGFPDRSLTDEETGILVDVLVGNEEDMQMELGLPGTQVAARSKIDTSGFVGMIENSS